MRLDIPAGTAVRFEPGDEREVPLVAFGGARRAIGFAALVGRRPRRRRRCAWREPAARRLPGADAPLESVPLEGTDADLA